MTNLLESIETTTSVPEPIDHDANQRSQRFGSVVRREAGLFRSFVANPGEPLESSPHRLRTLTTLVFASLLSTFAIGVPLVFFALWLYPLESVVEEDIPFLLMMLLASVVAPFMEEIPFRLGLSQSVSRWALGAALVFQGLWLALVVTTGQGVLSYVAGVPVVVLMALQLWWAFGSKASSKLFSHMVWVGSVSFGLVHITNFDPGAEGFDLRFLWIIPLLVSPQIMAGFIYSYVRVRLGFAWALAAHGLDNFVLSLIIVALAAIGLA